MNTEIERKVAAWQKATPQVGYDPNHARKDYLGNWIVWSDYGDRTSQYGWEIDHILPTMFGGTDVFSNLRALHWRANAYAGGVMRGLLR